MNIEECFVMKKKNIIYFDNAATTFKPKSVINKELEYLTEYTANSHRGDYNISFKVDDEIDNTRDLVAKFINAKHKDEIIFTSNTTDSLNLVINGFFGYYLSEGDEVIITKSEHASNILPWLMLKFQKGIVIKYASLNENNELTLESIEKEITKRDYNDTHREYGALKVCEDSKVIDTSKMTIDEVIAEIVKYVKGN